MSRKTVKTERRKKEGPKSEGGGTGKKHGRLNNPPCCISRRVELIFDASENYNNFMKTYIDKLL